MASSTVIVMYKVIPKVMAVGNRVELIIKCSD